MTKRLYKSPFSVVAIALIAVVVLTACGGSDEPEIPSGNAGGAAPTGTTSTSSAPDAQAYVDCLRDEGIAISDPNPETGLPVFDDSVDMESAPVQAALDKCGDLLPSGIRGESGEVSDAELELYLQFAECARQNGMPDFPDPQPGPDGMFAGANIDRGSAEFQAVNEACGDILAGTTD